MAEEAAEQVAAAKPAIPGRRKTIVMGGVIMGVMVVEALVVVVLAKSFMGSSPAKAHGEPMPGLNAEEGQKAPVDAEVKITEFRTQNRKGQQIQILECVVFATVPEADKAKLEGVVQAKSAKIKDRFIAVVRAMDPERFIEPDLITLRGQLKNELSQVVNKEASIGEVLFTNFNVTVEN